MSRLLHRYRKSLASAVLGLWTFALFVGIANACSWDGVSTVPHPPATAAHAAVHATSDATDEDTAPGCEEFCSNDVPLLGVLQQVQEPPAGLALLVATHHDFGFLPISAPELRLARGAHPPQAVPFFLRIVRLTL
jgi:hypothetical protein